ncbi:PREDICTED: cell division cycle-associated protein 7-like [Ipomoea nil]|uniref:cell division cycle-associated protein 7-like n=1 Tax=Ipomoea nil TaxID=35883 RepID=UPI00090104D4|nr:PREDICTED: cell division cycle-associated protein 7-like [Ipomoea nil]
MEWERDQTANDAIEEEDGGNNVSEYEQFREERIKENLERMQKLGIFELSRAFQSTKPPAVTRKTRKTKTPQPPLSPVLRPQPIRRSSRLQNVTPVSYTEVRVGKSLKSLGFEDDLLREAGSKPETYSEEHEKLLGSTKMNWTLFVDGYGKDGKRIYDPVKGKTCHQCRQKTLGHRTHCSKCNMVQGQFCGDCLYMRYGEHVLEANCNPDWICPVCRGICNCSLCRQAKGWAPTGPLYKKIKNLGYESVAHYLIQTRRANTNPENNVPNSPPDSAKGSLPFSDVEATLSSEKESYEACNDSKELPNSQTAEKIMDYEATESLSQETIPILGNYPNSDDVSSLGVSLNNVKHASSDTSDGEPSPGDLAPETSSKSIRKRRAAEGIPGDSIAERQRQRHN